MTKRLIPAVLSMAILATACASDDDDGGGQQGATQTTVTAEPARGGTLVVAIPSDPGSLNPAVTSNGSVHTAAEPLFNGVVGWGPDGNAHPRAGRALGDRGERNGVPVHPAPGSEVARRP